MSETTLETLSERNEVLKKELEDAESQYIRLKDFSNKIYSEIEENKALKLKIEIGLQNVYEQIQRLAK